MISEAERENSMKRADLAGIIVCGGKSTRFGGDKATSLLGGERLIDRVIRIVSLVAEEVIIAGDPSNRTWPKGESSICFTEDVFGTGPLAGIYAGLLASSHDLAIVVACDMPFLNPALLAYLADRAPNFEAVVPEIAGTLQPLHAVYHRSTLPVMHAALSRGEASPLRFLDEIRPRVIPDGEIARVDPRFKSFFNINSRDDLTTAEDWLRKR
jgi:molybdopterin-guanine dinucleotide biosynthesis protein A